MTFAPRCPKCFACPLVDGRCRHCDGEVQCQSAESRLEVVRTSSGAIVKVLDLRGKSKSQAEKILRGLLRQLDQENFHIADFSK